MYIALGITACLIACGVIIFLKKRSIKGKGVITDGKGTPLKSVPLERIHAVPADEPVTTVRAAVFYRNMIYLKERPAADFYEPGRRDIPFEFYYTVGLPMRKFIRKQLKPYMRRGGINLRYSLRYMYHDERISRDVFLYLIYLEDEKDLSLTGGKFWTLKQIGQDVNKEVFSSLFENELEHYRMILPVWEKYMNA